MSTIIVNPGQSIQFAIDNSSIGDTIVVKDGTYNERVMVDDKYRLYIKSENLRGAIIDGTNIGTGLTQPQRQWGNGLFDIKRSSFIDVRGFNIRNSLLNGILIEYCENISVIDNYTYSTYSSGVQSHYSQNILVDNNEIELAANAPKTEWVQEIISLHEVDNFEIKNNYVHDGGNRYGGLGGEGIDAKAGSSNGSIHHNKVVNVNSTGIYVDAWDRPQFNVKVYNNFVKNTGYNGMAISGEIGGIIDNVEIFNNICTGCDAGMRFPAYNVSGGDAHLNNINVHHNTIYNNNSGIGIGEYAKTIIDGLYIHDNLFSNNTYHPNIHWMNRYRHNNINIDHNYYDIIGSYVDMELGTNYVIGGDPLFVDSINDDFRLQSNSPAKNFGAYHMEDNTLRNLLLLSGIGLGLYYMHMSHKNERLGIGII